MSCFDHFDSSFGDGYYAGTYDDGGCNDSVTDNSDHVLVTSGEDMHNDSGIVHYHDDYHYPAEMDNMHMYGDTGYLDMQGNAHEIMNYRDPLLHSAEYRCNPFDVTGGSEHQHYPGCGHQWHNHKRVHVDGYVRDDGTYVEEHWRTAPDGDFSNNISK